MKKIIKRISFVLIASISVALSIFLICDHIVTSNSKGRVYDSVDAIPYRKVGLVLGTNPQTRIRGRENLYFKYRIEKAAELYHAGKVSYLLLSGDNSREGYNEPEAMKDSLMAHGVPESAIVLDFAGFRTLDSVVRCKEVFGQDSATIISQYFHNERAIYIADHRGLDAIAINAKDGKIWKYPPRRILREWISRVKLFIDEWIDKQPHFLGEPIEIGVVKETFPVMKVDTTENLIAYYPEFSRIDLVCDTMPSKEDTDVIFCAEAAFTADYLDEFTHSNICGPHVSGGDYYQGYGKGASGYMTWADGQWHFGTNEKERALKDASKKGGMGFTQYMVIKDGKIVSKPFKDTAINEYRCLCEKDGRLCIVDSRQNHEYAVFRDALIAYGVKYALYMDMGTGWNYSWWRDEAGDVHEIHHTQIPYTTNWITFYK